MDLGDLALHERSGGGSGWRVGNRLGGERIGDARARRRRHLIGLC
jgi:hypothetical protein